MTKSQINFIFNQHGGKEKVLGEMMYELYFDNPRNYIPDKITEENTKEKRLESIVFDDSNELIIIKETAHLFDTANDYTPTSTTIYMTYDILQGIYIATGPAEIQSLAEKRIKEIEARSPKIADKVTRG